MSQSGCNGAGSHQRSPCWDARHPVATLDRQQRPTTHANEIVIDVPPTEALRPRLANALTQAKAGEQLIIISDFHNGTVDQGYNISARIEEALSNEIA